MSNSAYNPWQSPWTDDVLGPVIVDGDMSLVEPRTAALYFVGAAVVYDAVLNVRRVVFAGTGGTGLPNGTANNQLMRWNGSEAVFTLMTAAMHGQQADGLLHAIATSSAAGFAPVLPGGGTIGLLGTTNGTSCGWLNGLSGAFFSDGGIGISKIQGPGALNRILTSGAAGDGIVTCSWSQITDAMVSSVGWAKITGYPTITCTAPLTIAGGASADLSTGRTLAVSSATTSAVGVVRLAGDLAGTGTSPTVAKINGASVPAAGALTTGHVLQVSGASALSYGYVANANVSSTAAIAVTKLATGGSAQILTSNGTTNSWGSINDNAMISAHVVGPNNLTVGSANTILFSDGTVNLWTTLNDAAHGQRGGGNLHATLNGSSAGFAPAITAANRVLLNTDGATPTWGTISNAMLAGGITWSNLTGYPTITCTAPLLINGSTSADLSANRTLSIAPGGANSVLWSNGSINTFTANPIVGSLGIGVTALAKLDVAGTTAAAPGRTLISDDGAYAPTLRQFKWSGGGTSYQVGAMTTVSDSQSPTGGLLKLGVSTGATAIGSETMVYSLYVNSGGRVGVGTSTPTATFEVNGTAALVDQSVQAALASGKQLVQANSGRIITRLGADYGSYTISPYPYENSSSLAARVDKQFGGFSLTGASSTKTLTFSTAIHGVACPTSSTYGRSIVGRFTLGWLGNGHLTNGAAQMFLFALGITSSGTIQTFNISNAATNGHLDVLNGGQAAPNITTSWANPNFSIIIGATAAGASEITRFFWEVEYGWAAS
ncbi:MAG: hypothetical protein ABFD89_17750 [Bryobacteraceae bacterium]